MIRFKLNDGYTDGDFSYECELDFVDVSDFYDWDENYPYYEDFTDFMAGGSGNTSESFMANLDSTESEDSDGIEWVGFWCMDCKDVKLAMEKWKEFFKSHNKLI